MIRWARIVGVVLILCGVGVALSRIDVWAFLLSPAGAAFLFATGAVVLVAWVVDDA